jgi:hypothetical protein
MFAKFSRAAARWVPRRMVPDSGSVTAAPTAQQTIKLIDDWITAFPPAAGIDSGGHVRLFEDTRAAWGIERLGGVKGKDVLELGPLEGAHTYLLDRAGANSITAIEAHKRGYLKCLLTKEVMGIDNAHFLLDNFLPWLDGTTRRFDVIWASGVLYHMTEPLTLLQLIARHTDNVFIWTHYFPEGGNPHRPPFFRARRMAFEGRDILHFDRLYLRPRWRSLACGGVGVGSCWLRRDDILFVLRALGFSRIETAFEDQSVPYRHSFALVAAK